MATEPGAPGAPVDLYEALDGYGWDGDHEFQGGLKAILGSASSPEQVLHLTLRARCFYYSRKFGTKVDFDSYKAWRESHQGTVNGSRADNILSQEPSSVAPGSEVNPSSDPLGNAPTPASFAEICQLIAEGKPIPGIKEIPDTVLEGQATTASKPKRRKPWEKDSLVKEPDDAGSNAQPTV